MKNSGEEVRAPVRGRPARMRLGTGGTPVYAFADGDVRVPIRELAQTSQYEKVLEKIVYCCNPLSYNSEITDETASFLARKPCQLG